MSEKVKLPKTVCDALNRILPNYTRPDKFFSELCNNNFSEIHPVFYESGVSYLKIMRALVLGYEPEFTAEEQIKKLWDDQEKVCDYANGIREGIKQTLRIHAIHYDWLEGDAE